MADLIDRQAAITTAVKGAIDWNRLANPQYSIAYCIGESMRALPSVDAEPVRHGHWDTVEDWDGDEHYQCSECGAEFVLIDGTPQDNDYLYCPHCGALMKELISKEAAIKTVFSMCCRWDTEDPNDLKLMLLSAFQDLPPARQWIPTKERKPDLTEKVIWQFDYSGEHEYLIGSRDKFMFIMDDAVAWMPLPEPYKGEES